MKKCSIAGVCIFALALAFHPTAAEGGEPKREILGIRLDTPRAAVQKRLHEIGKFVRDERKRQEIWEVRDKSFSHLVVGFDSKNMLRYVTAVAREDKEAKRVGYGEIGDINVARQAGDPAIKNFNYEWNLPAEKRDPEMMVTARGRDPEFLTTYSLKRVGEGQASPEKEQRD